MLHNNTLYRPTCYTIILFIDLHVTQYRPTCYTIILFIDLHVTQEYSLYTCMLHSNTLV